MVVLLLLACAPEVADLPVSEGVDETPAPEDTASPEPFEPVTPEAFEPALVVFLGDSITRGEGASGPDLGYVDHLYANDDALYPAYAGQDLVSWFPSIVSAVDVSVSGAQTDTVLEAEIPALETWLAETHPDGVPGEALVFLTIGGNDLQPGLLPFVDADALIDETLGRVDAILGFFGDTAVFPYGSRVFLTNVYEPSDGVGQSPCFLGYDYSGRLAALASYNTDLQALGDTHGATVVDLHGHFLGHGRHHDDPENPYYDAADPTLWFAPDCIHPNDPGHHQVRRLFLGAVAGQDGPFGE